MEIKYKNLIYLLRINYKKNKFFIYILSMLNGLI